MKLDWWWTKGYKWQDRKRWRPQEHWVENRMLDVMMVLGLYKPESSERNYRIAMEYGRHDLV